PRRTAPDGTGYVRGLYRLPNVPEEKAELVEREYMKKVDDHAAKSLHKLLDPAPGLANLTAADRVHWARFLHCLVLRNPEYIGAMTKLMELQINGSLEDYRADYDRLRGKNDPPTFEEFVARFRANPLNTSANRFIHRVVDSENVVLHLCQMTWNVVRF